MTKSIEEYYNSFPSVLKSALSEGKISFEEFKVKEELDIEDSFKPMNLYRRIHRDIGDTDFSIKKEDFYSQIENNIYFGKKIPRRSNEGDPFKDLGNYSCSFSKTIDFLEFICHFNFAKPQNILLYGQLQSRFGIVGISDKTPHVHCWIFEEQDLTSSFSISSERKYIN